MPTRKKITLSLIVPALLTSTLFASESDVTLQKVDLNAAGGINPILERKTSSSAKIVISKEEIERFGDQSVGDVLKRLPGMSFTGPAGYVEDVRFRGAEKGYTQILIDGEPIVDGKKDRQFQVSRLSADMIERIEIIKQTTAEFDSDGIAGTINIILKNPPKGGSGNYSATYGGSNGKDIKEAYLSYGDKIDDFNYIMSLNALERPLYKRRDRTNIEYKDNSALEVNKLVTEDELEERLNRELSAILKAIYKLNHQNKLTLSGYFIDGTESKDKLRNIYEDGGVIGAPAGDNLRNITELEDKSRTNGRLLLRYDYTPSSTSVYSLTAMHNEGGEKKDKSLDTLRTNFPSNAETQRFDTEYENIQEKEKKIKADASFLIYDMNLIKLGAEYSDKDFTSQREQNLNGTINISAHEQLEINEKSLEFYAMDEFTLENHTLTPGLRFESYRQISQFQAESRDGEYSFLNPSLHYLWGISQDLNFRASVAKKVRKPRFNDLYAGTKNSLSAGLGEALNPIQTGNLDLQPEKSLGFEAGFEYFMGNNSTVLGVNAYQRDITDRIEELTIEKDGLWYTTPVNVGKAKLSGLEFDASTNLDKYIAGLNLYGNYSLMRGESTLANGTTGGLKDVPDHTLNLGFDQNFDSVGFTFGAAYNRISGFDVMTTDIRRESEAARDMVDIYALQKINNIFNIRLAFKNITEVQKGKENTDYYESGRVKKETSEREFSAFVWMATLEGRF